MENHGEGDQERSDEWLVNSGPDLCVIRHFKLYGDLIIVPFHMDQSRFVSPNDLNKLGIIKEGTLQSAIELNSTF